jgi:hypothetical protein
VRQTVQIIFNFNSRECFNPLPPSGGGESYWAESLEKPDLSENPDNGGFPPRGSWESGQIPSSPIGTNSPKDLIE